MGDPVVAAGAAMECVESRGDRRQHPEPVGDGSAGPVRPGQHVLRVGSGLDEDALVAGPGGLEHPAEGRMTGGQQGAGPRVPLLGARRGREAPGPPVSTRG